MRKPKEMTPISPDDQQFFLRFYEENSRFMYYIAGKYTTSQADCEDIVQEALLRLMRNISKLKGLNRCTTAKYIVLTIRSVFLDVEKDKKGSHSIFLDDNALETLIRADILITDGIPHLSARLEVEQLRKSLPPRDWLVLEGKYILGYTQEELGKMAGVSPDSIRMILCRARSKAREILRQDLKGGDENE